MPIINYSSDDFKGEDIIPKIKLVDTGYADLAPRITE